MSVAMPIIENRAIEHRIWLVAKTRMGRPDVLSKGAMRKVANRLQSRQKQDGQNSPSPPGNSRLAVSTSSIEHPDFSVAHPRRASKVFVYAHTCICRWIIGKANSQDASFLRTAYTGPLRVSPGASRS